VIDNNSDENFLESNLLRLLTKTSQWMESEIHKLNKTHKHEFSIAEIKVLDGLRGKQKSIAELARVLQISRQAVHKTIHKLKDKGYLQLVIDKNNKKDRKVIITENGKNERNKRLEDIVEIEQKISWVIGERNLDYVKEILFEHIRNIRTQNS